MFIKFSIKLNPYPSKLLVLYGKRKLVNDYLKKISEYDFDSEGTSIRLHNQNYNYVLCLDYKESKQSTIGHESVHITWFMNEDLTLNFSSTCDEQQAYLVSFIMDEIDKKINNGNQRNTRKII